MIRLLTYADGKNFEKYQKNIDNKYKLLGFDEHIMYCKNDIDSEFFDDNKQILEMKRGSGYWLWKPYFILKNLKEVSEGDVVLYVDCGDEILKGFDKFLLNNIKDGFFVSMIHTYKNKIFTKKDCFSLMGCDEEKYWNSGQVEAGVVAFEKTEKTIRFVEKWLNYCKNINIISDIKNISGENFDGFVDHRHDQSVLTNLVIKEEIKINKSFGGMILLNRNK
jgi:hypothetical protein